MNGSRYSSSLSDCTEVLLKHYGVMEKYKSLFSSSIYSLNYENLVINTANEIQSLISWLGWNWDDRYLSSELSERVINTASLIQARSPINKKSLDKWWNYKDLLNPAIAKLIKSGKFADIKIYNCRMHFPINK